MIAGTSISAAWTIPTALTSAAPYSTLRAMHHVDASTATLSQQRPARARST
jgi:hypothetical protein